MKEARSGPKTLGAELPAAPPTGSSSQDTQLHESLAQPELPDNPPLYLQARRSAGKRDSGNLN